MDIPRVLERLHPGLRWGDQASTSNTYAELKEDWPEDNPKLSSPGKMQDEWAIIEAEDAALPSKADARARVDSHIGNSVPKMRAIVALLLEEKLKIDPGFLKRNGIDI